MLTSNIHVHAHPAGCYAISNADEYWAEGTQAWFEATIRTGGFSLLYQCAQADLWGLRLHCATEAVQFMFE